MLRNKKDLANFAIHATDRIIGHVKDFYFDDGRWTICYLVVVTENWVSRRTALISPISIGTPNRTEKEPPVLLTKKQVEDGRDIDTDKPVSRQHKIPTLGYYGYPSHWGGNARWGAEAFPNLPIAYYGGFIATPHKLQLVDEEIANVRAEAVRHRHDDPHLRSCSAGVNNHSQATGGDFSHGQRMLVDDMTWAIGYFIVDTTTWRLGHQVPIAPQWVQEVCCSDRHRLYQSHLQSSAGRSAVRHICTPTPKVGNGHPQTFWTPALLGKRRGRRSRIPRGLDRVGSDEPDSDRHFDARKDNTAFLQLFVLERVPLPYTSKQSGRPVKMH